MRARTLIIALVLGLAVVVLPLPALARGVPETLAATRSLGDLHGQSAVVTTPFPIDFLGVSWTHGAAPKVRFLASGAWTQWQVAHEDDMPKADGRTFSSLVSAPDDATAYQLNGEAETGRAVAINTTDGPRAWTTVAPVAEASVAQPAVVSRQQWGADESLRFNPDGSEKWPTEFYPTQKLVIHHTATQNNDPDPAATVRAIYRYHAIDKGWGDIGYNFLVDAAGTIYKGRYSGPAGSMNADTPTGENAAGFGVTAAHVGGYNSGTMGIAVLGTYTSASVSPAARGAVVDHLAWEADHHGLDPQGTSTYTNPVNGTTKFVPNISGHRDWGATECPGDLFYGEIPSIRSDVAAKIAGSAARDTSPPSTPTGVGVKPGKRSISLKWLASTDTGGSGLGGYEVWRAASSAGTYSKIASTASLSFVDGGLTKGKTYWYYVVAFDGAGNRSAPSTKASATAQ